MRILFILLQGEEHLKEIQRKLAEAPDNTYAIGYFIASLLPFTILVILAYLLHSYMKRNREKEDDFL